MPDEKENSDWFTVEIEEQIEDMACSEIEDKDLVGVSSAERREILRGYAESSEKKGRHTDLGLNKDIKFSHDEQIELLAEEESDSNEDSPEQPLHGNESHMKTIDEENSLDLLNNFSNPHSKRSSA